MEQVKRWGPVWWRRPSYKRETLQDGSILSCISKALAM